MHKSRIPIPSFSTEEVIEQENSDEKMTTRTETATVTPTGGGDEPTAVNGASTTSSWFDGQRLLRAEAALQVMLRSSNRNQRTKNDSRIPLSEFWSLVSKLSVTSDSKGTKEEGDDKKPHAEQSSPDSLKSLSTGERILHDMLYVGSPSLYQFLQDGNESEPHLEFVQFSGNRMERLRRLICGTKRFDQAKSDSIVSAIHGAQKEPARSVDAVNSPLQSSASQPDSSGRTAKVIVEPFIRPNMTLEERVHARHQARQERKPSPTSSSLCSTTSTGQAPDQEMLLSFADSLWSQARTIQRTQAQKWKMSGEKGPPPPAALRCGMALSDVVELLSGSRTTTGSSKVPVASSHQEKKSRKQIFEGLRELHRRVPYWITFSDEHFSKKTIVWIGLGSPAKGLQSYTAYMEYAAIRTALGNHSPSTSSTCKGPILPTSAPDMTLRKRPLTTENKEIHADWSFPSLVATIAPDAKKHRPSPPSPPSKESLSLTNQEKTTVSSKKTMTSGSKRPAGPAAPSLPPTKKARGLRINKHLIMTDADYDGGMVIQPSLGDSPRGLKRLFTQLNAGQRI
jgi:hypothetical protein